MKLKESLIYGSNKEEKVREIIFSIAQNQNEVKGESDLWFKQCTRCFGLGHIQKECGSPVRIDLYQMWKKNYYNSKEREEGLIIVMVNIVIVKVTVLTTITTASVMIIMVRVNKTSMLQ